MACLSPDSSAEIRKWITFLQLQNVIGIGLAKISVCALVLRVIDKAAVKFSRFLWAIIAFVITVHLAEVIVILVQCKPLEALWNPNVKGKCSNRSIKFQVLYIENGEPARPQGTADDTEILSSLRCVYRFDVCGNTNLSNSTPSNEHAYKDSIMLSYGPWGCVRI